VRRQQDLYEWILRVGGRVKPISTAAGSSEGMHLTSENRPIGPMEHKHFGTVISVNVGFPREIQWRGQAIRTSIIKEPVQGRVKVSRLNIEGDAQADLKGHGGEQRAVMVYQRDSYLYWAKFLGRPDFPAGHFGENLTVDGLPDAQVCIGDRYRIGTVLFEVTQPRVTCFKVGIRLDNPAMPALMVSHKRPGFYFRVIEEGELQAGDAIYMVQAGSEEMSVSEVDTLLYGTSHPRDALERASRITALSPGWQGSIKSLLDAASSGTVQGNAGLRGAMPKLAWTGLRPFKVRAVRRESADVRSFELVLEDGQSTSDALPGQYLTVKVPQGDGRPALMRNYSLCGPAGRGYYRIGVKREESGLASRFLHDHVASGDMLEVGAPRGVFILKPSDNPIALISAGIGVTPMLAILYAAANAENGLTRPVWWIHTARDGGHRPFATEISKVLSWLGQVHICTILSRPSQDDHDFDRVGHLDGEVLRDLALPATAECYLCGPAGFLESTKGALLAIGVLERNIHMEVFGNGSDPSQGGMVRKKPHAPSGREGRGPMVTFARSGVSTRWDDRFGSVLELAEACEVPVRWSCRSGVCHNCESALIDGEAHYTANPLDPPALGMTLICCTVPASDIVLDL
jgi:MOSC domain-containing protein YiiM/ferredoxin-NADP reductase